MGVLMLGSGIWNPSPPKKKWIRHYLLEESPADKEVFSSRTVPNGSHCPTPSHTSLPQPLPPQHQPPPPQPPQPPQPPSRLGTREVHNNLEKKRRAQLKECFELLKKQVPISPEEKKTSNLSILHSAIRYIQTLRRKDREYEHELERLAREKIAAQQRLAALKKDLSAQWDHIDFNTLLPNSLEPELRRHSQSDVEEEDRGDICSIQKMTAHLKCSTGAGTGGTVYSSPSSLSSTSSQLQTVASPISATTELMSHHVQMVQSVAGISGTSVASTNMAGTSSAPPSQHVLVSSGPTIQLLPSSALRMIPETQLVQSSITIPNGVIGHGSVANMLTTKHANADSSPLIQSGGIAHMVNHSIVVSQPSGQVLLPLTSPSQLGGKVMTTPLLKPVGQVPLMNTHQFLVKPTMVVVSTPSNTTTNKLC
ncbi:uncharacterized protein LOC142323388 isoform X2 [Lycorma delicatula]|uniref:uncharacterized protein LOC142323388 isoform X2 n=1 Tax=Lycorma delicatula TaxID=130591 RepID=UPI003F511632